MGRQSQRYDVYENNKLLYENVTAAIASNTTGIKSNNVGSYVKSGRAYNKKYYYADHGKPVNEPPETSNTITEEQLKTWDRIHEAHVEYREGHPRK